MFSGDTSDRRNFYRPRRFTMGDYEHSSRGLTGLRNLGNTCYMNAALQALSNCPPLREYYRTYVIPPRDDLPFDDRMPSSSSLRIPKPISQEFSIVVRNLWSDAYSCSSLAPMPLLMKIREKWPQFRGYNQQDSQEFIRCLLDLLHQEMRHPVRKFEMDGMTQFERSSSSENATCSSMSSSHTSSREDLDMENDQFETADSGLSSDADDIPKSNADTSTNDESSNSAKNNEQALSDVFDGELISGVKCQTCQHISYTKESFQDISLSIPTIEQLEYMKENSVELSQHVDGDASVVASTSNEKQVAQPYNWVSSVYWVGWILIQPLIMLYHSYSRYLFNGSISLEACLKAFFSADQLHGEVTFPLYDLDMRPFIRESILQRDEAIIAEYDLVAVISHRGSGVDYGHYIAYCRNENDNNWYEYDDATVTRVNELEVMNKEAYVLFYQKKMTDEMDKIKMDVRELWEAEMSNTTRKVCSSLKCLILTYNFKSCKSPQRSQLDGNTNIISTHWLLFFNFSEPGPINNYEFLCVHGNIAPSFDTNRYMFIKDTVWDFIQSKMGGGPAIYCMGPVKQCAECYQKASQKSKYSYLPYYMVSRSWFDRWRTFVNQVDAEPPPPINNESLLTRRKDGTCRLRPGCKSLFLTREQWLFLHQIYGGGPEVYNTSPNQPSSEEIAQMIEEEEAKLQQYYENMHSARATNALNRRAIEHQDDVADDDMTSDLIPDDMQESASTAQEHEDSEV
ncbi:ubiquitin carboxyl-terminal hydrolase domain-containing protein [Ditylenchus destructor]|nr:ubiquitin carboxyl-terminal hydrolase domain-containing protein [Ditylenchus destructor]